MVKAPMTTSLENSHDPHWSDVAHRGLVQQALSFLKIAARAQSLWKAGISMLMMMKAL